MKMSKVLEAIQKELKKPLPEPRVVVTKKEKTKMAKKAKKAVEDDEDTGRDESDEDEGDEDDEEEEEAPKAKKSKKAAKSSKPAKSSKKAAKSNGDDGGVSIQELAEEAGINAQSARVKLRDAELGKPDGGRWRWKDGSKDLKAARKALGL